MAKTLRSADGRSTDFILAAAAESAHRALREREALLLSERDQVRLAQAVLGPQPPPPRLVDAKDERAHGFYLGLGFLPFDDNARHLFLVRATIERLLVG